MLYGILADIVVWIHLGFVIFCALGALLVVWRHWVVWLHLPTVFWAVWIELSGGICPLTPLENWLRNQAGQGGYHGDFVAHYLMPVLYPAELTRNVQILLGMLVLIINAALYAYILFRHRRRK